MLRVPRAGRHESGPPREKETCSWGSRMSEAVTPPPRFRLAGSRRSASAPLTRLVCAPSGSVSLQLLSSGPSL